MSAINGLGGSVLERAVDAERREKKVFFLLEQIEADCRDARFNIKIGDATGEVERLTKAVKDNADAALAIIRGSAL